MVDRDLNAVFVSPDGQRYALMLVNGDVARDRVVARILVGRLDAFEDAAPAMVTELSTDGLGRTADAPTGAYELTAPAINAPRWLDNERLALLWNDSRGVRQVVAIDVNQREVRYLTRHESDVMYFGARRIHQPVVYGASAHCVAEHSELKSGFAVQAMTAWLPLDQCELFDRRNHELFVVSPSRSPQQVLWREESLNRFVPTGDGLPLLSPDGRYAIAWASISGEEVEEAWRSYEHPIFQAMVREAAMSPGSLAARQLKRLMLIDLVTAQARALLPAPAPPHRPLLAWSPDSRAVVVGRTFAALNAKSSEAAARGFAFVEVDVAGRVRSIPIELADARMVTAVRWASSGRIELDTRTGRGLIFERVGGRWGKHPDGAHADARAKVAPVRVEWRQGLNTPPALYAVDAHGRREALIYEPNPQLRNLRLGAVEWIEARDRRWGVWEGRLYYPVDFESGQSYPLVVQTHTYAGRDEFSLSGKGGTQPALGPGVSAYIAQPLANRGFFVLHGALIEEGASGDSAEITRTRIAALEHVIERLVERGLVRRSRVGLMGFSASGWLVSYAISHSSFPYAAAITDDNKEGSYLEAALAGWPAGLGEDLIGAPPFGAGLTSWLRESPALNADRIRTPLLLSVTSPGFELGAWEMFSRLRHLGRPVELFLIPNFRRGAHNLQNPTQLRALQERALDWWCFWLKDEEDADLAKAEQYRQWRVLRARARAHGG